MQLALSKPEVFLARAKSLQLCLTLCNPVNYSPPSPLSMGFSGQEYWKKNFFGVGAMPFSPGDLPNPGIKLASLASPTLAGGFFTTSTIWEALLFVKHGRPQYV